MWIAAPECRGASVRRENGVHPRPLRVADTARGGEIAEEIGALEGLVRACRDHALEAAAR